MVSDLHSQYFRKFFDNLSAELIWVLFVESGINDIFSRNLVRSLGVIAIFKHTISFGNRVFFLVEFVDHGNGWTSTDPLNRHPGRLALASQVLDIVRVFYVLVSELNEIPIFLRPSWEVDVATFRCKHLITWCKYSFDEVSLTKASTRPCDDSHTTEDRFSFVY